MLNTRIKRIRFSLSSFTTDKLLWYSKSRSNWNLEELVFKDEEKSGEPGEKSSEQGREPTTHM